VEHSIREAVRLISYMNYRHHVTVVIHVLTSVQDQIIFRHCKSNNVSNATYYQSIDYKRVVISETLLLPVRLVAPSLN
jgi:hypothetical protein